MLHFRRIALLSILALASAGCAAHSSPGEGLTFAPPPGWIASPGFLGFIQFWRPPVDDGQVLMLIHSPKPMNSQNVFANDRLNDTIRGIKVERREHITICGSQAADYIEGSGTSSRGNADRLEAVITDLSGAGYFALYVHPVAVTPNASASAALRELCAKS